jgi:nucleolar protein 14
MPWLYFAFVQSVFAFVGRPSPAAAAAAAVPGANLPFTFAMPETPQQLENIVGKLSAEETGIALERIRKCHAPTLKEDNRKKTQTFLGLLLQRFEVLAGVTPLPVAHLDVVAVNLAVVAASVPFFAATAARARLEKMSARLRRALRDNETGWPPARTLLLLSLFADLFPTTDKQHPVGLVPVESR